MTKPGVVIELTTFDRVVEGMGLLAMAVAVGLPFFFYTLLPDIVPRHFDLNGNVDGLGGKKMIWIGPLVGIILYTGLAWLSRRPDLFNYPVLINNTNKEYQYRLATRIIRILKTFVACMVAYVTYAIIQTGLGNMGGLGGFFGITFGLSIFGTIGVYIYKAINGSNSIR